MSYRVPLPREEFLPLYNDNPNNVLIFTEERGEFRLAPGEVNVILNSPLCDFISYCMSEIWVEVTVRGKTTRQKAHHFEITSVTLQKVREYFRLR